MEPTDNAAPPVRAPHRREAIVIVVFGLVASAALVVIDYLVGR